MFLPVLNILQSKCDLLMRQEKELNLHLAEHRIYSGAKSLSAIFL